MTRAQLARTIWPAVLLAAALPLPHLPAQQTGTEQHPALSAQAFYQNLVQQYRPSALPSQSQLLAADKQIRTASPAEVSAALPWIAVALRHKDVRVQKYAAMGLLAVSLRPDSAKLLQNYTAVIDSLLDSPDEVLQGIPMFVYVEMNAPLPPEARSALLAFLKSTDRAPQVQVRAMGALLRLAPQDSDVIDAAAQFLSRPLDWQTREGALNAVRNTQVDDLQITDAVIASLKDPHPGVKLGAMGALDRIGVDALIRAQPILQRLARDPNESPQVRSAASKALDKLTR